MYRTPIFFIILLLSIFTMSCGGNPAANSPANANNSIKLDPANMPPGLSASPIQEPPANAPGISANSNSVPKGTTPMPGIPSPTDLKKPVKPGATPTPGIPSADEMRKMLGQPATNANAKPQVKMGDVPMMKSNKNQ